AAAAAPLGRGRQRLVRAGRAVERLLSLRPGELPRAAALLPARHLPDAPRSQPVGAPPSHRALRRLRLLAARALRRRAGSARGVDGRPLPRRLARDGALRALGDPRVGVPLLLDPRPARPAALEHPP